MKKKLTTVLTAVLIAALSISVLTAQATRYPDIVGHWAEAGIVYWSSAGVLAGYPDGTFKPDEHINRAEMAQVLTGFAKLNEMAPNTFIDMNPSHWYYASVLKCVQAGYIAGFEDNTFRGQEFLTREQAIAMVARTVPLPETPACDVAINDPNTISPWAIGTVNAMINARCVPGFSNHYIPVIPGFRTNTIAATNLATRAFVVELLYTVIYYPVTPTATPTPEPTPTCTPAPAKPGEGGGWLAITTTPNRNVYTVGVSIQETTRGGKGAIYGPYPRSYLASDVEIILIVSQIIAERVDFKQAYDDPYAGAIMDEGFTAFVSSNPQDWENYVDKYMGDVTIVPNGSATKDMRPAARNRATIGEAGAGIWALTYNIQQGTETDSAGDPVFRVYTVTITINQS